MSAIIITINEYKLETHVGEKIIVKLDSEKDHSSGITAAKNK